MVTSAGTGLEQKVRDLLERQIQAGVQIGVQVAAYKDGQPLIDVCAGRMGKRDDRPVQPDTLFNCWSTTKGVAAAVVHRLVDRGLVEFDAPVARYWPAFAQNGKEGVTVTHILAHQAGLHAARAPYTNETLADWDGNLRYVEQLAPAYPPGTKTGYHSFSYAWTVGGLVEHATGRSFGEVLHDELAVPLGLEDELFIGIPDGVEDRLATLSALPISADMADQIRKPGPSYAEAIPPSATWSFNDLTVRKACVPSANGHFSARALARLYGALANGGEVEGIRIIGGSRIPAMQRLVTDDYDIVLGNRIRKGLGFWLGGGSEGFPSHFGPRPTAFGHSGNGGSTGFADPDLRLGVGVTLNLMQPPIPEGGVTQEICDLIRAEVGG
jgi:CubicO group peptidase (beta-lactamase class C family)